MEYNTSSPIYLQVMKDLKKKMIKGKLRPGDKMPSSRDLAVLYKVNQNTAARIYRELEAEGYCYTKRGIGTFVSEAEDMIKELKKETAEQLVGTFLGEMKDLGYEREEIVEYISIYKEEESDDGVQ